MIRFIHTADWQLGKPFGRMPDDVRTALQEARLDAIDAIGKLAADKSADDVLVAGDVFDTFEPGERVVRQALTRSNPILATSMLAKRSYNSKIGSEVHFSPALL